MARPGRYRRRAIASASIGAACVVALATTTSTASAQDCTYAACALRIQGRHIVAGAEPKTVTKLGNWSTPDLRPWLVVSDSTERYVTIVEENWSSGAFLGTAGAVALVVGFALTRPFEASIDHQTQELVGLGLMTGGLLLSFQGSRRAQRARDALASAIWYYNGTLEGGPIDPAARDVVPPGPVREPGPRDYARRGAVVGVLVGVAAGLAITAQTDELSDGFAATFGTAAAGGLAGYLIGKAIPR